MARRRVGAWAEAFNPATGEAFATYAEGGREDARRRLPPRGARRRLGRVLPVRARRLCTRVADAVTARRDDLAAALTEDQGKPLHAEAFDEVDELVVYFRMAAEDAVRTAGTMPPSIDGSRRGPCSVCRSVLSA